MRSQTRFQAITAIFLILCASLLSAAPQAVPAAPQLAAKGYVLQDFNSGQIIAEENGDQQMEPASLTKMMTTYVVAHELRAGNISLEDKVTISNKAWRMPGSRMFVEVNTQVSVEDLLKGIIIQSGNDATVAIAEHVAGSEETFASLMNQYAVRLGMTASHFVNSTGLPDKEHFTTPHDLAKLARALIRDFPDHYKWYSDKKFTYNNITQYNRNKLLWHDESVDGIKTGHTESAGFCLVASALREDMRLISVVLGASSERAREQESKKLLNYGFRFYRTHRLYEGGKTLSEAKVWKGREDTLALGLQEDLFITVPRGSYQKLKPSISYASLIEAPVIKHAALGTVDISLNDKVIASRELLALHEVKEGGWWKRLIDAITLFLKGLFS
ncbi:D-alanyl-D-alanine carboxypeptidase family protein [Sulfuriflexus mobilis]|uniref:D-alanyl-D-alanine carboxypeptidase family protein n=1 Tax=Sulfuriflexus mobilis TaxID=1811807 RepID=UPI0018D566F0